MHMFLYIYICKCIRIHSVCPVLRKKFPPKSWTIHPQQLRRHHLEELYSNGMAATTLRGHEGGTKSASHLDPLEGGIYLSCFGSRFGCGGYL